MIFWMHPRSKESDKKTLFETQKLCWHQQKAIKNRKILIQYCKYVGFTHSSTLCCYLQKYRQEHILKNGKFYSITQCCAATSKIIRHFENSQLIFTWNKMASMCAKFHCLNISSLKNTRVGHFCHSPPPK